jgi:putative nucleotidyltransferase with HDIG domain
MVGSYMDIKKILQIAWISCGIGITSVLFIHFFMMAISPYYLYSFLSILSLSFLPYSLFYKYFSEHVQKSLFIVNVTLFVGFMYWLEPWLGYALFYFTPVYAVIFKKLSYFIYSLIATIASYLLATHFNQELTFESVTAMTQLSLYLCFIIILYLAAKELLHSEKQNNLYTKTMEALVLAIEAKDMYTRGHSNRVSEYSIILGKQMKKSGFELDLDTLRVSSLLHDIGKVNIPLEILQKPGKLTDKEYKIIQLHPVYGADIAKQMEFSDVIIKAILHHHERMDGRGYPQNLNGNEIPIYSKIISIADTFDALTTDRSYRDAFTYEEATEIILSNSGTQFDSQLIPLFKEVYPLYLEVAKRPQQTKKFASA